MKHKKYDIVPRGNAKCRDFSVDVYSPSGELVGSTKTISESIDLIDDLNRQTSFLIGPQA